MGLTPSQTERIISGIETLYTLLPETPTVYSEWRRLVVEHSVSGKKAHDTRLVAAMNVHGIAAIITFNVEDFRRYPKIRAVLPVDAIAMSG